MRQVELAEIDDAMWAELVAGEPEPFGGGPGEPLSWRPKPLNVAICSHDGRLLAAGGIASGEVLIARTWRVPVVGLGGVIVTRSARGQGLGRTVVAALLERAPALGGDFAVLFCRARLVPFYASFSFAPIDARVYADQPGGQIEMPLGAMYRPLAAATPWPAGAVEVIGEPF